MQEVKKGDTFGLVDNTGNARTTSPHLHFGIYPFGGAIDPLPFVNKTIKKASVEVGKNIPAQFSFMRSKNRNHKYSAIWRVFCNTMADGL